MGASSDSSVIAVNASVVIVTGELGAGEFGGAHHLGVLGRLARVGAEPIVGILPVDKALQIVLRPIGQRDAKGFFRCRNALAGPELCVPAGDQRLGLAVECPQELAFPAVPDARSHSADVGDGQHQ